MMISLCLLAQILLPGSQQLSPSSQPAAPASQPSVILLSAPDAAHTATIVDSLRNSIAGQIIEGQRTLTLNDIRQPAFWLDTIRDFVTTILAFIPRFLGTMVFLLVFWIIYRGVRRVAVGSMKRSAVDSSIRDMLASLIKWSVMGFGLVIACNQLGIPIVAMLTGVSIIGLAVGFAAQETLANFIAGVVVFLDKPFKVGEWIEIETTFGKVARVTFRSTRIINNDGEIVVYPNTAMLANRVTNHSTHPVNRINVNIGIAYKASIADARKALLATLEHDARIVSEPPPAVVVDACGDSSINLILRFWINDQSLEKSIRHEYMEKAKLALDAAGIEIPFPHVQLLLEESQALAKFTSRTANG